MSARADFEIKGTIYSEITETRHKNQSINKRLCDMPNRAVNQRTEKCAALTCLFQYRKSMPNTRPYCAVQSNASIKKWSIFCAENKKRKNPRKMYKLLGCQFFVSVSSSKRIDACKLPKMLARL